MRTERGRALVLPDPMMKPDCGVEGVVLKGLAGVLGAPEAPNTGVLPRFGVVGALPNVGVDWPEITDKKYFVSIKGNFIDHLQLHII